MQRDISEIKCTPNSHEKIAKIRELIHVICSDAHRFFTDSRVIHRVHFSHKKNLCLVVLFPDEKTVSLCCWDSRNADRQKLLSLGTYVIVAFIKKQKGNLDHMNGMFNAV